MKALACLVILTVLSLVMPSAHGFDAKPGRYKGTLTVTTSFPNTDVKQSVTQRVTARLEPSGRMLMALSNTFDGIEETGQHAGFVKFVSAMTNDCFVRILKDNFITPAALVTVKGKVLTLTRSQQLSSPDAEGLNVAYDVGMVLKVTRVGP
ncbi:MAG: hypothetical protein EOP84_08115 [Verrucomicrobiaceae bacterium]|nr:MAG: hypothetical protein EOP84_08115 [Verrucomicrobiaceae bacterium]